MSRQDKSAVLAAVTFFAKKHPGELCGSNGLPLTPNSISIFGESQILRNIAHPYLCEYLDIIRGKHERIVVVSEHYHESLVNKQVSIENIPKMAFSILEGLNHMNLLGIVHRALSPENILFNSLGDIKLFNYGLYHMTNRGAWVSFPIGSPKYMAPDIFLSPMSNPSSSKVDVWSLGIILVELCLGKTIWSGLKLPHVIRKILSLINSSSTIFERIANEHNCSDIYKSLDINLKNFINICLSVNIKMRPTPEDCLKHEYFNGLQKEIQWNEDDIGYHIAFLQRVSKDNVTVIKKLREARIAEANLNKSSDDWPIRELAKRSLKERYFLWQLAGGDVNSQLKKQGMIKSKPPILTLPCLVLLEGTAFGEKRDYTQLLDLRLVNLPMLSLQKRIAQLPFSAFHPLIDTKSSIIPPYEVPEAGSLPLIIREKDIEYQFHRVVLFQRLLVGYPSNRSHILMEANKDVTPFLRGDIWASILGIKGDFINLYKSIDKETTSHTDRQIDVDIPRCHQYNELLASGTGHKKLKRVLKAWVISHPRYVYWQGLDSLCAPFLYLNFNNEAQAYACLSAFIPKYLHDFFLKDNSAVIREYLAKFRHLVAFHDPELACHLDTIHFIPELFAIPWFLTVFSHVFPLHKILYLWDQLLLGDASFPFHVGLAVLHQLRDTLLSSGFNECILLFSDLPEVDIERCVKDSAHFYSLTPRSITFRAHDRQLEAQDPLLDMSPVSLLDLQDEFCSRISASDLLLLLQTPEKVKVVDIRNVEQYCAQSIPDSINLPFNLISLSDRQVPQSREGKQLEAARGKILAVVGSGGENLTEFCRWLVQCSFPYVCSLHGGIQVLKAANVLQ